MKKRLLWIVALTLTMSALAACSVGGAQGTPPVTADLPDGGTLSVALDEALSSGAAPQTVSAIDEPDSGALSRPDYVCLELEGYVLETPARVYAICALPVAEYEAMNDEAARQIAELRALLDERPPLAEHAGDLPDLPVPNAGQVMQAQPAYVDFDGGAGVRYLTMHVQDTVPVTNQGLAYSFQGLTDDGAYFISVGLPVSHPSLPDNLDAVPEDERMELGMMMPDEYVSTYGAEVQAQLDGYAAAEFTPPLALLDALVSGIAVTAP